VGFHSLLLTHYIIRNAHTNTADTRTHTHTVTKIISTQAKINIYLINSCIYM